MDRVALKHQRAKDAAYPSLLAQLRAAVGAKHVLTGRQAIRPFSKGFRFGDGSALAVVRPGRLVELWRALEACVSADAIVIMQAANTGLTGGSTPADDGYDRPVVLINAMRIAGLHLIEDGRQVICLPGVSLTQLEAALKPIGREPHSVIGSSCIGASVLGGVCNNSGGALVRRGPAFTEMALFAQLGEDGDLRLINALGVDLGSEPEAMLARLESGDFKLSDICAGGSRRGSDRDYDRYVRDIEASTPARFNADPRLLSGASGCAGRIIVFGLRLDTFEKEERSTTFYIGANDPSTLSNMRRGLLRKLEVLPISAEYLHRDAFDISERYGKDVFLIVKHLGAHRMALVLRLKTWLDAILASMRVLPANSVDRLIQAVVARLPQHLPRRLLRQRNLFEHHLIVTVSEAQRTPCFEILSASLSGVDADLFECTPQEAKAAMLHRFAAAGAANRFLAVNRKDVGALVSLDVALARNETDWLESILESKDGVVAQLHYGHFLCHVFHGDYLLAPTLDARIFKTRRLEALDRRGAEYPAEHNVGHLYEAKPALAAHYRQLDPTNSFNPGLGRTSRERLWR